MNDKKTFKDLIVYKEAKKLALMIYQVTSGFPKEERYSLTSQMRRSVYSVGANIVEGNARNSKKDRLNFFNIARSSLTELEYALDITLALNYLDNKAFAELDE